jgi:PPOX class probable F420-dependent enzyme
MAMDRDALDGVRTLIEGAAPAVLTTYRRDGSAHVSPVWFRWDGDSFEVVVAKGDVKLRHLASDPRCVFVVFEATPPFRGVEIRGTPALIDTDVTAVRSLIAGKYLGTAAGERFASERRSKPGVILRLKAGDARVWDLSAIT